MSDLYKTAVIGDSASVSGFAALGLSVFHETDYFQCCSNPHLLLSYLI